MIQSNLINASYLSGVKKLIFLGSSCIYPKYSKQPIKEEYLLSGKVETIQMIRSLLTLPMQLKKLVWALNVQQLLQMKIV